MRNEDADFVRHEACPSCGSSDANALYSNGNHFCFSCETFVPADTTAEVVQMFETHDSIFLDVEHR